MKNCISVLIGTLLLGSAVASAQDYDDIYYSAGSTKKENKAVEVKKQSGSTSSQASRNPYFSKYLGGTDTVATTYSNSQVVNGRDVDEYNRRYRNDDMDAYYAEENAADYVVADSLSGSDFTYTDRIVKFHNADIIDSSDDAELVELYYENRPTVNLVVGTTYSGFYDPYYWGGYYPSSYYWYRPYRYGWYSSWYSPWYDPWYSGWYGWHDPWYYSHSWYCGWHNPWGYGYPVGGHHHHYYPVGRPRISDGGRLTAGHSGRLPSGATGRPGYASASNRRGGVASSSTGRISSRATSINRSSGVSSSRPVRQSTTVSRPGTTGSIRSSVGASATQAMTERRSAVSSQRRSSSSSSYNNSYNSRNSYNSSTRSSSSYNSGSSYSGGRSSAGSSSGGGRSSGGGGGRGGRR